MRVMNKEPVTPEVFSWATNWKVEVAITERVEGESYQFNFGEIVWNASYT